MRFLAAAILAAASIVAMAPAAAAPDIRFCPATELRAYPLESRRQIGSVLLQDVAIVQNAAGSVEITGIDLEILQSGRVVDRRRLAGGDLRRQLSEGPAPQAAPAVGPPCMAWQESRLREGAGDPVLAGGRALFIAPQLLAFQGPRDTVRVTVAGRQGGRRIRASASIPLRLGLSRTIYRFPLHGVWWAGVGATPHGGHRWSIGEEFALDIGRLGGEGLDHRGSGERFEDFYGYGEAVVAAAAGRVVAATDGIAEDALTLRRPGETPEAYGRRFNALQTAAMRGDMRLLLGNYVVIDHGGGEFGLYAHLRPGSVRVRAGAMVAEATPLGELGSSGNSTAPHLHFQLCDGPDPLNCAGIPIAFKGIELPWADFARPPQSGDMVVAD